MILHEARSQQRFLEVGVIASVDHGQMEGVGRRHIIASRKHRDGFVARFKSDGAIVAQTERAVAALLGGYFDDTRSPTRTVFRCLGGVFQDGKTLNVGRIDGGERSQIAVHAVDDDQRIVAACERSGAAHTHTVELCHAVFAGCNVHTRSLSAQCIERIGDQALVHLLLRHNVCGTPLHGGRESFDGYAVDGLRNVGLLFAHGFVLRQQRCCGEKTSH